MCHFITATIPADAELGTLRLLAGNHALALTEVHNPHIQAQLQAGERCYLTTLGSCDCGTVLGSGVRYDKRSAAHQPSARDVSSLRRRGWSEGKIERWLLQHSLTADRDTRVRSVHAEGRALEARDWQQFLREVLASGSTDFIGLLLHWYHGSIDGERIEIRQRRTVCSSEITPEFLMRLPEDELYVFLRSPKTA